VSKYVDISEKLHYDGIRTYVLIADYERGIIIMTDNEKELIRIIRENDNPERALMTATVIVLGFLKQHGSSEEPSAAALRVLS
jgi:hypothetical protein